MDFRKLGNILALIGVVVLAAAVLWWFNFYSSVIGQIRDIPGLESDASLRDMGRCLYSSDGFCGLISVAAHALGKTAYEPMLFWAGVAALVLGVVVRLAAKPAAT